MNTPHRELLRLIKDETGWSEPRIATEIKTSQATVNRLLNGQRSCQVTTYLAIEELAQRLRLIPKRRSKPGREEKPSAEPAQ